MDANTPSLSKDFLFESFPAVTNPKKFDYLDNDFFIFNDLENIPLNEEGPGRLDVSMISICVRGYSRFTVNMQEYYVSPGTLSVAFPDQILQSLEVSDDFKGVFIITSRRMSDETFPKIKIMLRLFFYTKEYPCINLTADELSSIMEYYNLFWNKLERKDNATTKDIVQTLLIAMFFELYAIYKKRIPRKPEKKDRKHILFDQFMRLLSESYKQERSVNYYAEKLFLTPKHLSSVIKEISGKTAGEWIDNFVIFEAKTLLKSSQKNIQEIADELNFANQSFFGKYFRHYTGMSPKEYRKR